MEDPMFINLRNTHLGGDSRPTSRSRERARKVKSAVFLSVLIGMGLAFLTGCEDKSSMDEAIEEVQDEAGDAKEKIKDEIDDHS